MEYRNIIGYENLYKISEYGDIIHLSRKVKSSRSNNGYRITKEKYLKIQTNKYGYNYILLADIFGNRKHYFIHQLVTKTFLQNPNNYISINHKDENKTNNHYSNLEWCTVRHNNLYNNRQEKINKKLQNTLKTRKPVLQFDLNNNLIQEFQSINEACRKLGIFKYPLSKCCNNKKLTYKGYFWKFKEKGSTTISKESTPKSEEAQIS
jgi:hypothetical protein